METVIKIIVGIVVLAGFVGICMCGIGVAVFLLPLLAGAFK